MECNTVVISDAGGEHLAFGQTHSEKECAVHSLTQSKVQMLEAGRDVQLSDKIFNSRLQCPIFLHKMPCAIQGPPKLDFRILQLTHGVRLSRCSAHRCECADTQSTCDHGRFFEKVRASAFAAD